jgi:hypothetical protein
MAVAGTFIGIESPPRKLQLSRLVRRRRVTLLRAGMRRRLMLVHLNVSQAPPYTNYFNFSLSSSHIPSFKGLARPLAIAVPGSRLETEYSVESIVALSAADTG